MKSFATILLSSVAAFGLCRSIAIAQQLPPEAPDAPAVAGQAGAQADVEVLLKGPVHEAFAAPVVFDPVASPVVPKQPPEPIVEDPPEQQLAGDDVIWIPGYWSWDDERNDFLWISGLWRRIPPGQRWVPGYWSQVEGGYQYISGAWLPEEQEQVTYLPAPPSTLERGPNSPAPDESHFWVPGCWNYYDTGYRWQPGYWAGYQPGWVWEASCYRRASYGYVFSPGYWDYVGLDRGCMFAPIYFRHGYYAGYRYRPYTVIPSNYTFMFHLFVDTSFNRYCFGDYYDGHYGHRYSPWYAYGRSNRGYLPLLAYYDTMHRRQGSNYISRLDGWHRYFASNPNERPRGDWDSQQRFDRDRRDAPHRDQITLAANLSDLAGRDGGRNFVRFDASNESRFDRQRDQFRDLSGERRKLEASIRTDGDRGNGPRLDRPDGDRPGSDRPSGDRPGADRPGGDRIAGSTNVDKAVKSLKLPKLPDVARTTGRKAPDNPARVRGSAGVNTDARVRTDGSRVDGGAKVDGKANIDANGSRGRTTLPGNVPGNVLPGAGNRDGGNRGRGDGSSGNPNPGNKLPRIDRGADKPAVVPGLDKPAVDKPAVVPGTDAVPRVRTGDGGPRIRSGDRPAGDRPSGEPRRIETPKLPSTDGAPRIRSGDIVPKVDAPKLDTLKLDTPRIDTTPRIRSGDITPRISDGSRGDAVPRSDSTPNFVPRERSSDAPIRTPSVVPRTDTTPRIRSLDTPSIGAGRSAAEPRTTERSFVPRNLNLGSDVSRSTPRVSPRSAPRESAVRDFAPRSSGRSFPSMGSSGGSRSIPGIDLGGSKGSSGRGRR